MSAKELREFFVKTQKKPLKTQETQCKTMPKTKTPEKQRLSGVENAVDLSGKTDADSTLFCDREQGLPPLCYG